MTQSLFYREVYVYYFTNLSGCFLIYKDSQNMEKVILRIFGKNGKGDYRLWKMQHN